MHLISGHEEVLLYPSFTVDDTTSNNMPIVSMVSVPFFETCHGFVVLCIIFGLCFFCFFCVSIRELNVIVLIIVKEC